MAKKTQSTTALTKWDEQLAKEAEIAAAIEKNAGGGGNFISLQGGRMTYDGGEIPENKMNVIVVDHIITRELYRGKYDPDNPSSPDCYAFGRVEDDLKPHEDAPDPQGGDDGNCKTCEFAQWGSADQGRGQACGYHRRLALITEGGLDDIANADIAYLRVPVTSVKAWAGYVKQIATVLKRPPFAVITEVSLVPDKKTQFKLVFKLVRPIEDSDSFEQLIAKKKIVESQIEFAYVVREIAPAPPKRGGRNVPPARGKAPAAAAGRRQKF